MEGGISGEETGAVHRSVEAFTASLVLAGRISEQALERALDLHRQSCTPLVLLLPRLGLIPEAELAEEAARFTALPLLDERDVPGDPVLDGRVSPPFLHHKLVVPLRDGDDRLHVAVADPFDQDVTDSLGFLLGKPVQRHVAPLTMVETLLAHLYPQEADEGCDGEAPTDGGLGDDVERLRDQASEAPVIRLVNQIVLRAIETGASDIHLEAFEDRLRVRYRLDGLLSEAEPVPRRLASVVVSRIKIMAKLNIAERRLPQDGRIRFTAKGRDVDIRVSSSPTIHGESLVLRVLDRSGLTLDLEALGFDAEVAAPFRRLLSLPHGILLITGPTGSGKTTTLYASLLGLNTPERKILTIEDPVEYQLEGINQQQTLPQIGRTFAGALRSFLRQDPDVIMVGEIRDLETAQVAVQAALTGHLILSTLHTNDAASAVTRLLDMGVEDYLITSTLSGVLAQRLVRQLCPACALPYTPVRDLLERLGLGDADGCVFHRPVGCPACRGTGYQGRTMIVELLEVGNELQRAILHRPEASEIRRLALAAGMRTMLSHGLTKVRAGITSLDEVLRVTKGG